MSVTSEELNYLIWRYLQEAGHEVTAFALQDETKVHELDERYSSRIQIGCLVDLVQKGILYSEDESLINHKGELKSKEELEKTFTLFGALRKNQNVDLKFSGRFALEGDEEVEEKIDTEKAKDTANGKQDQQESSNNNNDNDNDNNNNNNNNNNATVNTNDKVDNKKHDNNNEKNGIIEEDISNEEFIKVLKKSQTFDNSVTTNWNPIAASVLSWGQRNSSAMIAVLQPESEKKPELVTLTHPLSLSADLSINPTSAKEEITVVSWAPKGHFLLTASENGELRLWTADGKLRNVLTLHQAPVITIRWNPDSTFILTQDSQNDTIIWDTNTGSAIQHIDYDFLKSQSQSQPSLTITQYNQSPENTVLGADATWIDSTKFLIPGVNGSIVLFQLGEKAPLGVLHGHTAAIGTLSYSSRLQLLASGSDDTTIRIWKGNSYSSAQVLLGHDQGIVCVDWLQSYAENIGLLISSSLDGSVRIWDVYSGSLLLASFLDGVPIFEAVLSPNQKWYAVGTEEGLVSIFDVSSETIKAVVDKTSIANEDSGISTIIGRLKIVAQYQPERANASINADGAAEDEPAVEDNFVTSLSWNCESTKLCISYNKLETVIIDL